MIVIISGPSGVGKDTVIDSFLKLNNDFVKITLFTTRAPRKTERDKFDYFFITKDKFQDMIANNLFFEYVKYCGNYYGILNCHLDKLYNSNKNIILKDININSLDKIKAKYKNVVGIFLLPPSMQVLKARLIKRGSESEFKLKERLDSAQKEINLAVNYDYIIINNNITESVNDINLIIKAENLKSHKFFN